MNKSNFCEIITNGVVNIKQIQLLSVRESECVHQIIYYGVYTMRSCSDVFSRWISIKLVKIIICCKC